jgi:MYXO-CTERM domain-containing protein
MKTKSLLLLAGAGAPLILSSAASADFVGLKIVKKGGFEQWTSSVSNLYAIFSDDDGDGIGDGAVIGVAGLPGQELNISMREGTFYQNPLNTNNAGRTAPPQAFVDLFPSLAADTFVTIGLKVVPAGAADNTSLTPTFPLEGQEPGVHPDGSWTDTRLQLNDGAWFSFNPDDPQARPGNADNPAGQVLIGQFSSNLGAGPNVGIFGTILIQGENADGSTFSEYISFDQQNGPAPGTLALLGMAGLLGGRRRRR